MLCSGTILAWGIIFSRLARANTHANPINHGLNSHSRRFLSDVTTLVDTDSYYKTTATAEAHAAITTMPPSLPTSPTCDATQPKFAINNLLIQQNGQLRDLSGTVMDIASQVDESNSQQLAGSIAAELQKTATAFKSCTSSVQLCGIDPKPLSANQGISLSDVSWSALQIVLTLKTIFESVSSLYKPFPIIQQTCSSILLSLSTALSSLIGACSEQLNLFDTRFFPLVTPQLKEFMQVDDNFSSFFGSFIPI